MLNISKFLATIAAWILFLLGVVGLIWTFVSPAGQTNHIIAFFMMWILALVASVVVMRIRKSLD